MTPRDRVIAHQHRLNPDAPLLTDNDAVRLIPDAARFPTAGEYVWALVLNPIGYCVLIGTDAPGCEAIGFVEWSPDNGLRVDSGGLRAAAFPYLNHIVTVALTGAP